MVRDMQLVHEPEPSEWLCACINESEGVSKAAQPPTEPTGGDDVVEAGSVPGNDSSPSTGPQLAAPGLY